MKLFRPYCAVFFSVWINFNDILLLFVHEDIFLVVTVGVLPAVSVSSVGNHFML